MSTFTPFLSLLSISLVAAITAVQFSSVGGECNPPVISQYARKTLKFSNSSSFKISLFADLHYGENAWDDWGPVQDDNSDRVMSTVLDDETPDFVIYLGDLVTANNLPIPNATLYWDRAISSARTRGIPFASIFGNHDDMPFEWPAEWFSGTGVPPVCCPAAGTDGCSFRGTTRVELITTEIKNNPLSHTQPGPAELWPSVSNYVLTVSSSKDPDVPVVLLYFFDSGGGSYPEVVANAQAKWFQEQSQAINPKASIPEVIFWHIPSTAYEKVAPSTGASGIPKPCVGSINMESVAPQVAEWGMMDDLAKRASVKAVFVGHNHGLDWCCPYQSLWLCFARHSGYGGYGTWPRGARILEMTEDPFSLKSWIRMEDGSVHSQVTLSS